MSVGIASIIEGFATRNDDQNTVSLAVELTKAERKADARAAVKAAVARILDPDKNVQSGCIKLLYEIGYREPALIAAQAELFIRLLKHRNNRLAWGGMIALSTIAPIATDPLFERRATILDAIRRGTVITRDNGIKALGLVAAAAPNYRAELLPKLLAFLRGARPSDVPRYAEFLAPAIEAGGSADKSAFREAIESRIDDLNAAGQKRVGRLLATPRSRSGAKAKATGSS